MDEIRVDSAAGLEKVQDLYGGKLLGRLRRHALRNGYGEADVEDVYQEALLRLVKPSERSACRAAGGSILPWLTKWGYWRLDDAARERRRTPNYGTEVPSWAPTLYSSPDGSVEVDPSFAASTVQSLSGEISPTDRQILRLRYEERLTTEQAAERLGISPAAAKKRAHDARKRLQSLLVERGVQFE